MEEYIFRQAVLKDIPFLVDTIVEAEKSGTPVLTYTTIFGLSEAETREYIARMLEEEIDGCELSVSGFVLAEKDGTVVGAVGAWVEGSEGIPSTVLKGNLLSYILPSSCLKKAHDLSTVVHDLSIDYIENTIQIGLVYVSPDARGRGLVPILLEHRTKSLLERFPGINEVNIQVFGNNIPAIKAYQKAGFEIILKKEASLSETSKYMPDTCKVLMRKII